MKLKEMSPNTNQIVANFYYSRVDHTKGYLI